MAAQEKGVDHDYQPVGPHSDEVNAIHPLGKIPVLRHSDIELCESRAVCGYLDAIGDGPSLVPEDPATAAQMEQWVSLVNTSTDDILIRKYLFAYIFPSSEDGSPDRAAIDGMMGDVEKHLGMLDGATASGHLAGDALNLADLNIMPILFYMKGMPEAGEIIANSKNLGAHFDSHAARESFQATMPPPPPSD